MKFEDMPPLLQEFIREQLFFCWDWTINPPNFEADDIVKFYWDWLPDGTVFFALNNKYIDFFPIGSENFKIIKSKKEGTIKIKWGVLISHKPWVPEDIEWLEE